MLAQAAKSQDLKGPRIEGSLNFWCCVILNVIAWSRRGGGTKDSSISCPTFCLAARHCPPYQSLRIHPLIFNSFRIFPFLYQNLLQVKLGVSEVGGAVNL